MPVTGHFHEDIHRGCVVITYHSLSVHEQLDIWTHPGLCPCMVAAQGKQRLHYDGPLGPRTNVHRSACPLSSTTQLSGFLRERMHLMGCVTKRPYREDRRAPSRVSCTRHEEAVHSLDPLEQGGWAGGEAMADSSSVW